MPRSHLVTFLFLSVLLVGPSAREAVGEPPPNILIITADNLGYGDLRCYNESSEIVTPHLDALADEGVRLTHFYTASPTCTVSRACLLTGRLARRHGLVNQLPGIAGNYGVGLNQDEVLLPEVLKSAPTPYRTGAFGKWNIGFAEGSRPTERGFDEFVGHASGNMDYYHHVYNGKHDLFRQTEPLHVDGRYATDLFADAAIEFIKDKSQRSEPWFCYLPFNAPHFPNKKNKRDGQPNRWQAPDDAFDHYEWSPEETDPRKRYCAVVTALDEAIGNVLEALERSGVSENTFVFFMSDNGAFRLGRSGLDVGINDPLRGGGVTCYEGGIRVAALARWPGKIPRGSVVNHPCWSPDLFVTCARLVKARLPREVAYDGKDVMPLLMGEADSPHQSLFFTFRHHAALRQGDWKIVREHPGDPWQLFHLGRDPGETEDLAERDPERVKHLEATFRDWMRSTE